MPPFSLTAGTSTQLGVEALYGRLTVAEAGCRHPHQVGSGYGRHTAPLCGQEVCQRQW